MQLEKEELRVMMVQSAEMGAANALKDLGLGDEQAHKDMIELRGLAASWREVKSAVLKTVTQAIVVVILSIFAVGFYFKKGG